MKVVVEFLRVVRVVKQWLQFVRLVQVVMWHLLSEIKGSVISRLCGETAPH